MQLQSTVDELVEPLAQETCM